MALLNQKSEPHIPYLQAMLFVDSYICSQQRTELEVVMTKIKKGPQQKRIS